MTIKPLFSEAVKVENGVFYNLPYHEARMKKTMTHFFGRAAALHLTPDMIPPQNRSGLVKCRIVYSDRILSIEYTPYRFKTIRNAGIVCGDAVDYAFKSTNRQPLDNLLKASGCDEIVIIKNGLVTDSSSANIVFEDASGLYTPSAFLLPGTKRACLLQKGVVEEREIKLRDLEKMQKAYLINAMIDLEDDIQLPLGRLIPCF